MNEFVEQFVIESRELIEAATRDLLALEQRPLDKQLLDNVFRAFHTLKGGAGIVEFEAMLRIMHEAEEVLSAIRSGARTLDAGVINDSLGALDQVTRWLDATEATGELPTDASASARNARDVSEPIRAGMPAAARAVLEAQTLLVDETRAEGRAGRLEAAARVAANVLRRYVSEEASDRVLAAPDAAAIAREIAAAIAEPTASTADADSLPAGALASARTLRVEADRIDALVNLTGELLVAMNASGHVAKLAQDGGNPLASALKGQHAQLERLVTGLQQSVLSLRVLPLRHVFQRFPRLIREMSATLGKPAVLTIEGDETEADKTIVEAIYEPLLHVMRNAMDHGLETAPERERAGKIRDASIALRAKRQGEHVVVEVQDDGRGVDVARVREVALRRGVASAEALEALSDAEAIELIFAPGFSTASAVTDLSGRGVGLDAVRTSVERLGGRVSIESRTDHGSTVRFVLPFSVMMTRVMTVEAAGQLFGIPLDTVVETVRVDRSQIAGVGAARALARHNRTIPVISLAEALHRPASGSTAEATLVVTSFGGQFGALEVDRIGEQSAIMLKPLDGLLAGTSGIVGTSMLGNGDVLLVLDIEALLS